MFHTNNVLLQLQEDVEVVIDTDRTGSPMKAESPIPADDNKELEKKESEQSDEEPEKVLY